MRVSCLQGGDVADIKSDSLIRVQVYSAIAYGARGLYYYCWSHGTFNTSVGGDNSSPLSNYMVVKAVNADAAKMGTMVLNARHVGAIRTPSNNKDDHSVPPGSNRVVQAMDSHLLVGVFSDGQTNETGFLVVVDLRTAMEAGDVPLRQVTLTINAACTATVVPGGADGWFERANQEQPPQTSTASDGTQQIKLGLHGGGGALLQLTAASGPGGGGGSCGDLLRSTRQWWYNPRTINFKHTYRKWWRCGLVCISIFRSCFTHARQRLIEHHACLQPRQA